MAYYDDIKDKKAPFESHYISAYGLAVKHGFTGSEEEWLESLSDYGIAKKHGFTGSEEEWNDAVNEARNKAEAAKTAAETAQTAAEAAQTAAEAAQAGAYSDAEYVGNALTYILEIQSSIEGSKSTVVSARKDAVSARDEAITAQAGAESAESNAEGAEGRINETVKSFNEAYGDFSLQAEKAKEHYDSRSNPHRVTAKQVGAYGIEETYSRKEVYNKGEIGLMFEKHGDAGVEVDELLDGTSSNPVANKVLYTKFASIDGKLGDIDTALDVILDIQANLTGIVDVELPGDIIDPIE